MKQHYHNLDCKGTAEGHSDNAVKALSPRTCYGHGNDSWCWDGETLPWCGLPQNTARGNRTRPQVQAAWLHRRQSSRSCCKKHTAAARVRPASQEEDAPQAEEATPTMSARGRGDKWGEGIPGRASHTRTCRPFGLVESRMDGLRETCWSNEDETLHCGYISAIRACLL